MRKLFLILSTITLILWVPNAYAQINIGDIIPSYTIKIFPEVPSADESVTISVDSFSGINVDAALFRWSLNGKIAKEGIGEKNLTFKTGVAGTESVIRLEISPQKGLPYSKQIVIRPSDIDIIWEAQTVIPPFYAGKALFTKESLIKLEAIPHFVRTDKTEIPKENIIYNWSANSNPLQGASGYGKYYLSRTGISFENEQNFEVTAQSSDGGFNAKKSITINPVSPQVLVYEENPLYGTLLNREVGPQYILPSQEVTFKAVPYYLSLKDSYAFTFNWLLNGVSIKNPGEKDTLTLRRENTSEGSSRISLQVQNPNKTFQNGRKEFLVTYESR